MMKRETPSISESTKPIRLHDQNTEFRKFKMADGAILKIVLSLYLSRKSSDFNEIWCADADCAYKIGYL